MKAMHLDIVGDFGASGNTAEQYDAQVTIESLEYRLRIISDALQRSEGYCCYVMGMGAKEKRTYTKMECIDGAQVVWVGSVLPKLLSFLGRFVSSYAGLVKIVDRSLIEHVFMTLVDHSMAGVYIFPDQFEPEFLKNVQRTVPPLVFDFGVKSCKDYFMYVVDADNLESSTGAYEIVSYGVEAIPELTDAFHSQGQFENGDELLH